MKNALCVVILIVPPAACFYFGIQHTKREFEIPRQYAEISRSQPSVKKSIPVQIKSIPVQIKKPVAEVKTPKFTELVSLHFITQQEPEENARLDFVEKKLDKMAKDLEDIKLLLTPKTQPSALDASVQVANELTSEAVVEINKTRFTVEGKTQKTVAIPSGEFSYQIIGFHDKPLTRSITAGQVFKLTVRSIATTEPKQVVPVVRQIPIRVYYYPRPVYYGRYSMSGCR